MSIFKPSRLSTAQSDKRNYAYKYMLIIDWEGSKITVDQANDIYMQYFIEGNPKAELIQPLIIEAKNTIRNMYPEEV